MSLSEEPHIETIKTKLLGLLEMGAKTCCLTSDETTELLSYVAELETQLEKIKKFERERWENPFKGWRRPSHD